jgi:RNA polymerase sigma-70 factor (ECF subfamily)
MNTLAFPAMAPPLDSPETPTGVLEAARSGDLEAFEMLMRPHERLVLVTALRLLGNLEDAQDASQEVFLRLYRNLGKLRASGNLAGWLYRVTVNVCHDVRARRPAETPLEEAVELVSPGADPQQMATRNEEHRALELSLRLLSNKERAAVVLRDLEGLSTEEVARILGASQATVRSQIFQARIKMKDFVERYFRRRL